MTSKITLKKIEKVWVLIIEHEDGSRNDYRFTTKSAARAWAKLNGLAIKEEKR